MTGITADACYRCGGHLRPGIAMQSTFTGRPDFADGEVVTMSPGGPGRIVRCMKCVACGSSVAMGRRAEMGNTEVAASAVAMGG